VQNLSYIALKNVPICQTYATPLTYVKMESGNIEPVLILIGLTLSKGGAARLFSKRIKNAFSNHKNLINLDYYFRFYYGLFCSRET
jgi:hypothetical protein